MQKTNVITICAMRSITLAIIISHYFIAYTTKTTQIIISINYFVAIGTAFNLISKHTEIAINFASIMNVKDPNFI